MSRTKHHGSKGRPSNTCPSGRKCPTCEENRRRAGEKDRKEAEMKQKEEMTYEEAIENEPPVYWTMRFPHNGRQVLFNNHVDDECFEVKVSLLKKPIGATPTDYDRTEPLCIMLSRCDIAIIDKHKSENQDPRDFLQRLISENLRVLRDSGGK